MTKVFCKTTSLVHTGTWITHMGRDLFVTACTCVRTCIHICGYITMCVCVCKNLLVGIHVNTCLCIYDTWIYMYVCECVNTCLGVYIYAPSVLVLTHRITACQLPGTWLIHLCTWLTYVVTWLILEGKSFISHHLLLHHVTACHLTNSATISTGIPVEIAPRGHVTKRLLHVGTWLILVETWLFSHRLHLCKDIAILRVNWPNTWHVLTGRGHDWYTLRRGSITWWHDEFSRWRDSFLTACTCA